MESGEERGVDLVTLGSKEAEALAVAVVYRPARLGGEAGSPDLATAEAMSEATSAAEFQEESREEQTEPGATLVACEEKAMELDREPRVVTGALLD
jgi:hypothetical protein